MSKINVHAGHNPDEKTACGAVGLIKESTEARKVKDQVISMLKEMGHTVYDCTVDNGTSQNDVLHKIVAKCNAHTVDVDVSIHFNSGRNDYEGDGSIGGTEVFVYTEKSTQKERAAAIAEKIGKLGFRLRGDNGVKISDTLYVLRKTKAPALLIEVCFVDDVDDAALYKKVGLEAIAKAIVKGITGEDYVKKTSSAPVATKYKVTTNGARLALREAAGTSSDLIRYVPNGSVVTGTGKSQTVKTVKWLQVKVDGKTGWMHSGYLKKQ
ncbi:MAG: N-acetylmuramoyl-L-alanine amidase [Lachnospiraceae bacterium]|nr:N-acetylmuramoyl-L-alanine amidase [Lachnospiraceae bacterium]